MNKPRLTYFDIPTSRGEECRLALFIAGVDFEDRRIPSPEWRALKPSMPFGSMPVLELPGKPPLAHSNAILVYLGRQYGLHPRDAFEAAQHEGLMSHVEDLRGRVAPTQHIRDPEAKKATREALARDYIPAWGRAADQNLGEGPFVGGDAINVVDLKLYMAVRWFASGAVDHVPADIFAPFTRLTRVFEAVRDHEKVRAWYAR